MTISDSRCIPSLALLYFFNRPFFFLEDAKNDTVSNSVVFVYLMLFYIQFYKYFPVMLLACRFHV